MLGGEKEVLNGPPQSPSQGGRRSASCGKRGKCSARWEKKKWRGDGQKKMTTANKGKRLLDRWNKGLPSAQHTERGTRRRGKKGKW